MPGQEWRRGTHECVRHGELRRVHDHGRDGRDNRSVDWAIGTELEQLRRKVAELEHLYQTAPIGLAFLDSNLRYQRINERLASIKGVSVEQHLG
jgi:PAS domain-containing protein